jgi:8-oxo-dGTP pyrophosphatase MutT (NUDIX family)
MEKKLATVLIIKKDGKILLGMKKRGFGEGKWNGFGGKPLPGENIEKTAIRETEEECGIAVKNIKKMGIIDFEFFEKPEWDQQVHFFLAERFEGEPKETEEMKPVWFSLEKIPYRQMWPDDKYWLPLMLSGKIFSGKFVFGESNDILEYKIKEIEKLK